MYFDISGNESFCIETIILDLNGTLTIDGIMIEGVRERIFALAEQGMRIVLFTGDTQGNANTIADDLRLEVRVTKDAQAKADEAKNMNPATVAAIGNGRIDRILFETVSLSLVVIQAEGMHRLALEAGDVYFQSINDALDFFLKPNRLKATMRK